MLLTKRSLLACLLVTFLVATVCTGAELAVCPGGGSYAAIQPAIDTAVDGDEIVVCPGTYTERIDFLGKLITVRSEAGAAVTIIDATGLGGAVATFTSAETSESRLIGFTLTGGAAAVDGGGALISNSSPTIIDCAFVENSAVRFGGGIACFGGNPEFVNCVFERNSSSDGGGMRIERSSPLIVGSVYRDNNAVQGAGLMNISSSPTVINCQFIGNTATHQGGGMNNNGPDGAVTSDPLVANCIFFANSSRDGGGAMVNNNGASPYIVNCTFFGNWVLSGPGGGMVNGFSSPGQVRVANCIVWGNSPDEILSTPVGNTVVTNSDIGGGWVGAGNIDVDPLFVDAPAGDLRLLPESPCIDAGSNEAVPANEPDLDGDGDTDEPLPFDLDGNARIVGSPQPLVEIGAYEHTVAITTVEIDIKPGSYPNSINLGSNGVVPAAILSSDEFDATNVDAQSILLAGAGVAVRGNGNRYMAHEEDVNGDGLLDLVIQVETENLNPEEFQDGYAILTGETIDGIAFQGVDEITIVPD